MIGIDQFDPSCVSNRFESLCVHVASYRKFPSKDRKTSEGCCRTPTVQQLSSWIAGRFRSSSGFARPTEPSMWSVSLEGELCWRWVLGNQLGRRCYDTQTISSWMFKLAWGAAYSLKNTSGFRIFRPLAYLQTHIQRRHWNKNRNLSQLGSNEGKHPQVVHSKSTPICLAKKNKQFDHHL